MFVNILNITDKIVDVIFKGLLIICGILLVISAIIGLIGFSKLGATATSPQERAKLLQKMVFTPTITVEIFIFAFHAVYITTNFRNSSYTIYMYNWWFFKII